MKVIALEKPNFSAKRITAFEALRRREAQLTDATQTYFAFHNLEPMFVIRRGDKAFFKYKNGLGRPEDQNNNRMTVRHWLMQAVLRDTRELFTRVSTPTKAGEFWWPTKFLFDRVELEYEVEYKGGRRRIDAMANLSPSCPNYDVIGPQLAIEICVTHPVTKQKSNVLKGLGLPCLEIQAHPDWQEPDIATCDDREIRKLEKRMRGLFSKWCRSKSVGKELFLKELVRVDPK